MWKITCNNSAPFYQSLDPNPAPRRPQFPPEEPRMQSKASRFCTPPALIYTLKKHQGCSQGTPKMPLCFFQRNRDLFNKIVGKRGFLVGFFRQEPARKGGRSPSLSQGCCRRWEYCLIYESTPKFITRSGEKIRNWVKKGKKRLKSSNLGVHGCKDALKAASPPRAWVFPTGVP